MYKINYHRIEIIEKILIAVVFFGFFIVIGTVGSMEQDDIGLLHGTIQSSIGLLITTGSYHLIESIEYEIEQCEKKNEKIRKEKNLTNIRHNKKTPMAFLRDKH